LAANSAGTGYSFASDMRRTPADFLICCYQ
jgi:hypothetical protein